jgi:hypothetical protein
MLLRLAQAACSLWKLHAPYASWLLVVPPSCWGMVTVKIDVLDERLAVYLGG